jgi:cytoskeletal protein CcmA (bactofilin family)
MGRRLARSRAFMFTKKPERDGPSSDGSRTRPSPQRLAPAAPPAAARAGPARGNGSASVIGADLSITGNLESKGEVQIEGEIQGDVHAQRIVIGERARIIGALIAEEVVVRGSVQGSIRGNAVTFQSSSRIEGDVFHKSLAIEQGAYFEGKSRRSEDPMSLQRPANVPPPAA